MLRYLRVTNFAILSDVTIELGEGLAVLTGETGAGKSLIVEAVNLLRGGRASADIPRAGAQEAVVEAIFEIPDDLRARIGLVLASAGLPSDVPEVVVRRVIQRAPVSLGGPGPSSDGRAAKSRTYVNGALTTAGRLAELGALLVDLSGQHQHQGLVDPARHREILDAFAGEPAVTSEMTAAWSELADIDRQLAELGGDERARADRADYLRFQVDELDAAGLDPGEDERHASERTRLGAVEELGTGARTAVAAICGEDESDDGAVDKLAIAARELDKLARVDATLEPTLRQIQEARVLADDAATELRRYADRLEGDPERLAWLDDRLELLRRLCRKHGGSLAEVIARTAELRAELDGLSHRETRQDELETARARALARAERAAAAVTQSRTRAGKRLEREVAKALGQLGMGAARVEVAIAPRPLGPHGADDVELLLSANKGEERRPLARVASGGELSRIMLALKLALLPLGADQVATYVFDEVDAGIGGATAQAVGALIRAVADHRQVLCVTHLPQIAAYADAHYHVEKIEVGDRTETLVKRLSAAARKDELARMLGGSTTARARAHAAELLDITKRGRDASPARRVRATVS